MVNDSRKSVRVLMLDKPAIIEVVFDSNNFTGVYGRNKLHMNVKNAIINMYFYVY